MAAIRAILVAVAGLTPQVITETLYYLTQVRNPPVTLAAIHVLTTRRGKERLLASLLAPGTGHFYAFCAEYGIDPASLAFDAECVHVLHDATGKPLDDIRTAEDSLAVADQIVTCIRRLTDDPMTRLHCSLAGGRKTQSVLLGFALQLYGRPQDTLLHVLVSEDVQDHPEFFYPPKAPRSFRGQDGRLIETHSARGDVAEIPYLRLRDTLLLAGYDATLGFAPAIAQAQHNLDMLPNLPPLVITCATRCIRIGAVEVHLEPLQVVLYAQLAHLRVRQNQHRQGDGFVTLNDLDAMRDILLQRYERLYGQYSERVAAQRRRWQNGIAPESLRQHFAKINRKLQTHLPNGEQMLYYRVDSQGQYGETRYGLRLPPDKIELREP